MIKLYTSMDHPREWVAYLPDAGWVVFPDGENGWEQRKPVHGLDPIHLRQVPLSLAARTGLLQAPAPAIFKRVA
jgi:hypothetical protein